MKKWNLFNWFKKQKTNNSNEPIVTAAKTFRDNASMLAGNDPSKNTTRSYRTSREKSKTINTSYPISMEEILERKGYGGKKHTLRKKTNKRKTKKAIENKKNG